MWAPRPSRAPRVRVAATGARAASRGVAPPVAARDGRATDANRRRAARARASALPPANEIAGFVVGAALLGLCVGGARLDGVIARAQARGMAGDDDGKRRERRGKRGGGVFVVPDVGYDDDGMGEG